MACKCTEPEYEFKCSGCNKSMFSDKKVTDDHSICYCGKCGLSLKVEIPFDEPIGSVEIINYLCAKCYVKKERNNGNLLFNHS